MTVATDKPTVNGVECDCEEYGESASLWNPKCPVHTTREIFIRWRQGVLEGRKRRERGRSVLLQLEDPEGVRLEQAEALDICSKWSSSDRVKLTPIMCSLDIEKLGKSIVHIVDENNMLRHIVKKLEDNRNVIQKGESEDGKGKEVTEVVQEGQEGDRQGSGEGGEGVRAHPDNVG